MKSNYLLPNKFKSSGWILLILGMVSSIYLFIGNYQYEPIKIKVISILNNFQFHSNDWSFMKIIETGIAGELTILAVIIGGLIVGFSKEKIEDEFIYKLRKDSLVWAFLINYSILIIAVLFIFDFTFLHVLVFNMFTPLIIFIIRFNFLKLKSNSDEE